MLRSVFFGLDDDGGGTVPIGRRAARIVGGGGVDSGRRHALVKFSQHVAYVVAGVLLGYNRDQGNLSLRLDLEGVIAVGLPHEGGETALVVNAGRGGGGNIAHDDSLGPLGGVVDADLVLPGGPYLPVNHQLRIVVDAVRVGLLLRLAAHGAIEQLESIVLGGLGDAVDLGQKRLHLGLVVLAVAVGLVAVGGHLGQVPDAAQDGVGAVKGPFGGLYE